MIGGFVRARLGTLTQTDIEALEALMEIPDVDLADWLTGRRAIPDDLDLPMLLRIKESLTR
jgi:antitoxin CptB